MLRRAIRLGAMLAAGIASSSCLVAGTVDVIPHRALVEITKVALNAPTPDGRVSCPINPIASSCGNGRYACSTDSTTLCETCACTP